MNGILGQIEKADTNNRWHMVGGIVVGVSRFLDKTHVHVADCPHYPRHRIKAESVEGCPRPDSCCVYVEERSHGQRVEILIGDSFWWQGGFCYWTPRENKRQIGGRCGIDFDIKLKKIGYSH